jgi:hypothetical protein
VVPVAYLLLLLLTAVLSHQHLGKTMARMTGARSGATPCCMDQLALLEIHIAAELMPVKRRLLQGLNTLGRVPPPTASGKSMFP